MKNHIKTIKNKWSEVLTLTISLIALILSCQANGIAVKQATPKPILINTTTKEFTPVWHEPVGAILWEPRDSTSYFSVMRPRYICDSSSTYDLNVIVQESQIRLANLGGVSTAIIDFVANIFHLDDKYIFRSDGNSKIFAQQNEGDLPLSIISIYFTETRTDWCSMLDFYDDPFDNTSVFPKKLGEYSAEDVFITATFNLDDAYFVEPTPEAKSIQIRINYSLELSTGEELLIPTELVLYSQ